MVALNPNLTPVHCKNLVGGQWVSAHGARFEVVSPYTGESIGYTHESRPSEVAEAVAKAQAGFELWREIPIKERSVFMFRFRELLLERIDELANTVALESGKTPAEGKAGVQKGIEVIEYALSLQNLDQGASLDVSRGVSCTQVRMPLGVALGIVPFNFPAMVPLWMFPIAITLGNAFVLKPSEKVPLTSQLMGQAMLDAGFPAGVFTIVNGGRATVESLIEHELIRVVGFVGSTAAARSVYAKATSLGKRCLALGGAKNHIILAPDADPDIAVSGIVNSFTGCAGQRCMAASVLVAVGDSDHLIRQIVDASKRIRLCDDMGALISLDARARLREAIMKAKVQGASVVLDGTSAEPPPNFKGGSWLGPTILDHVTSEMDCANDELFGPVLSIIREALRLDGQSTYGNATSVFTSSGAIARHVAERATSGMIGINIGVPVPREPFSFGGTKSSKFGQGDITGNASLDLWTNLKKVTTKWAKQHDANWMS